MAASDVMTTSPPALSLWASLAVLVNLVSVSQAPILPCRVDGGGGSLIPDVAS